MNFTAKLKKGSHIYTTWRGARRIQGIVDGVVFRLAPALEYVTEILTAEQIGLLRLNACVQVEMTSMVLPKMVTAELVVDDRMPEGTIELKNKDGSLAGAIVNIDKPVQQLPTSVPATTLAALDRRQQKMARRLEQQKRRGY